MSNKPKLWTADYIFAFLSNFLIFVPFYILVPILPFYLIEHVGVSESTAGVILSLYIIAALLIRPFSGYMVDRFRRKPFYLVCYALFSTIFALYGVGELLALFIVLRIIHGLVFGLITVSANTLAIDIMPSERRGEGIGFFGMSTNLAMAIGPMIGLSLHECLGYDTIFFISFGISVVGLLCVAMIHPTEKPTSNPSIGEEVRSLDRLFLVPATRGAIAFMLTAIGYGIIINYIGLYSKYYDMGNHAGLFFTIQAVAIVAARFLSSRLLNRDQIGRVVYWGSALLVGGFSLLSLFASPLALLSSAVLLGLGYGFITPAFQTMFINMAPHNRRGTANSTYFTAWDLGIGLGIAVGGRVIEYLSFGSLFTLCLGGVVISVVVFRAIVMPHYRRSKVA